MKQILIGSLKAAQRNLLYTLRALDRLMVADLAEGQRPPVFILGPPRSGTTLLYQIMSTAFRFACIPNISNRFYYNPVSAAWLGSKISPGYRSTFESRYGFESGLMSPSEGGNVWNRWFPTEQVDGYNYVGEGALPSDSRQEIRQMVFNLERLFKAPFITKNVKMAVRLRAIHEIFPKANFIQIRRDPVDIALSLLTLRRRKDLSWWSVMPREIDEVRRMPLIEQVVYQVYYLEKNIADDIKCFDKQQHYSLSYDTLCRDPRASMAEIGAFFGGGMLADGQDFQKVPPGFTPSRRRENEWVTKQDVQAIVAICKKLF